MSSTPPPAYPSAATSSSASADAARRATSAVALLFAEKSSIVVFAIIALVAILIVLAYIVYKVRRADLDSTDLVNKPLQLLRLTPQVRINSEKVPPTTNGQEFSYSFWLYLTDYPASQVNHYLLFHRGSNTDGTVSGANPVVSMDKGTNKMYITLRTNQSVTNLTDIASLLNASTSKYITATVDYVPMQRWVHIAFVTVDNLLTVFQDGQMYTVENVQDVKLNEATILSSTGAATVPAPAVAGRPIFSPTAGDVVVGAFSGDPSINGYLARLSFYNYGLTAENVRAIYDAGPVKRTWLSTFGISEWGVRTPVYKIDDEGSTTP